VTKMASVKESQDWRKSHDRSVIIGAAAGFGIMLVMVILGFAFVFWAAEYVSAPSKIHDWAEQVMQMDQDN